MERWKLSTSMFLMAFGAFAIGEAVQLSFGTLKAPEAGFWPLILAILLTALSLIHLGKTLKDKVKERNPFLALSGGLKRIGIVVGALIAFAFLFERLGYLLSVFLLMGFLLRVIKPLRLWLVLSVALLSSVISYLLFGVLLSTPLPHGILGI